MTSISLNSTPSSHAVTVAAGILAAHLALAEFEAQPPRQPREPKISFAQVAGTISDRQQLFEELAALPAEQPSLVSFYAKLLSQQESLGTEFETVLYENLWDLYSR